MKRTQGTEEVSPRAIIVYGTAASGARRGGRGGVERHLAAHHRALALVPPQHQRAGDVDAGVGAGEDADEEGEREVMDDAAAEQVERGGGEEHRAGGDDRPAQGLIERVVDEFGEGAAHTELQAGT